MEVLSLGESLLQNGDFSAVPNHRFCWKNPRLLFPGCFFPRFLLAQGKVMPAGVGSVCTHLSCAGPGDSS